VKETIKCCECGSKYQRIKKEGGLRCELCAQENWVRWLKNLGELTRDGEPDGHTPAMRPGQRTEHNAHLTSEIKKLKKLRLLYPKRAKAYAEKNKADWRAAPYEIELALRD
jgi:hypothetical protein